MAYLSVFLYFSLLDLLDRWFDYEPYESFEPYASSFCISLFSILWIAGSTTSPINLSVLLLLFFSCSTGFSSATSSIRLEVAIPLPYPVLLTLQFYA